MRRGLKTDSQYPFSRMQMDISQMPHHMHISPCTQIGPYLTLSRLGLRCTVLDCWAQHGSQSSWDAGSTARGLHQTWRAW